MNKKTLCCAFGASYYRYTLPMLQSFFRYHSPADWRVVIGDVGLEHWQREELGAFGEVRQYPPSPAICISGISWPAARARLQMMADLITEGGVVLYLDSDILVFGSVELFIAEFVASGKPIAMTLENTPHFFETKARESWVNSEIPPEFTHQDEWRELPMVNGGVIFTQGLEGARVCRLALGLYDSYTPKLQFAEQSALCTVIYELKIPFLPVPLKYNCVVFERYIDHKWTSGFKMPVPYRDTVPIYNRERVVIRHFGGHGKENYKRLLDIAILT